MHTLTIINQLGATAYTFTNVQNFLNNVPSQVNVTSTVSDPSIFFNGATGVRHAQQWFIGGFFQDEWKIKPNFTIDAGLRYDYFSPLFEAHDIRFRGPDTGKINASGDPGFRASKLNFSPRLGFAGHPSVSTTRLSSASAQGITTVRAREKTSSRSSTIPPLSS